MTTTDNFEFDELDELAAAYLDGEATPAEIERVEAEPEIQARVEQFRALAEAIAEPVIPPSAATRDAAIAAALAAVSLDDDANDAVPSSVTTSRAIVKATTAPVESLDDARSRRSARRGSRVFTIAKVAAAVMVVFLGLTVITQAFDGSNRSEVATDAATSADDVVDAASDTANDAVSDTAAGADDAAVADEVSDDAMEEEAMEEEAMDESGSAAAVTDVDGDVDAEADLARADQTKSNYLLPDDAIAERGDYIGDFDSFDEFVLDYRPASEGIAPQFVTPTEFNACDLTSLVPAPRALLYVGTATIAGVQRLVGYEPSAAGDRVLIFELTNLGECAVAGEATLP